MNMSSLTCIPVVKTLQGRRPFYLVDGFRYDLNFPIAWALNHQSWDKNVIVCSGPKLCEHCRTTGCINDVFISYCFNCQKYIYNGRRLTPIEGMRELPHAIYHWQMGMAAKSYGLDKDVIVESGILPPPPLEAPSHVAIDIADTFEDFSVKDAMYYELKSLLNDI